MNIKQLSAAIGVALFANTASAAPSTPSINWEPQQYSFVEVVHNLHLNNSDTLSLNLPARVRSIPIFCSQQFRQNRLNHTSSLPFYLRVPASLVAKGSARLVSTAVIQPSCSSIISGYLRMLCWERKTGGFSI